MPFTEKSISIWHEIHNAYRTRRILTGQLGGIEQTDSGKTIAIVTCTFVFGSNPSPITEIFVSCSTPPLPSRMSPSDSFFSDSDEGDLFNNADSGAEYGDEVEDDGLPELTDEEMFGDGQSDELPVGPSIVLFSRTGFSVSSIPLFLLIHLPLAFFSFFDHQHIACSQMNFRWAQTEKMRMK